MKSSRRVALSLGLATVVAGGLLSLRIANGQPAPTPAKTPKRTPRPTAKKNAKKVAPRTGAKKATGAAPRAVSAPVPVVAATPVGPGSPTLPQTVGISPASRREIPLTVFGGTGNGGERFDLQSQNVYNLLQQRGVPIPNVLHPYSTAKPSFIIERLIVLSVTGAANNGNNGNNANSSSSSGTPGGAAKGTVQPKEPTDAERTVTAVRRVVDAEISRGSGRLGGTHRRKLQFLRASLMSLEQANRIGSAVAGAIGGGSAPSSGGNNGNTTKIDPREIFYGDARRYARAADRLAPVGY